MGERPKVVVDVQFQGHETEYEIIQEQFEFELVGSRIHVRPCAPDHPQGAGYSDHPRKRPASPPNDPCEVFRAVKPKIKQERQTRSAKARSPSPSRRSLVEKQIIRCRDRSTSPCVTRKMRYEDCDERFPLTRRRPQRVNMKSEDSNTSFSSYPPARRQQRPIKKESSMWIISKRVPDNYSMDSNNSLGDVNNGSFQYSVQHDDDGNYSFTQPGRRNTVGPRCDMCNSALNDREPRSNMKQYRPSKEKRCSFSCHQCCSDEISPSVVFEEYEMFASTETIKRDTHIYDEEDEEEDKRKSDENKKSKGTGKNVKKEPSKSKSSTSLLSVNLKPKDNNKTT